MQPEDKIQEIAERAERLQEIGSSILRVARDELYLVLQQAIEMRCLLDLHHTIPVWYGGAMMTTPSRWVEQELLIQRISGARL